MCVSCSCVGFRQRPIAISLNWIASPEDTKRTKKWINKQIRFFSEKKTKPKKSVQTINSKFACVDRKSPEIANQFAESEIIELKSAFVFFFLSFPRNYVWNRSRHLAVDKRKKKEKRKRTYKQIINSVAVKLSALTAWINWIFCLFRISGKFPEKRKKGEQKL